MQRKINSHTKSNIILTAVVTLVLYPSTIYAVTITDSGIQGADGQSGGDSLADAGFSIPNLDFNNSAVSTGGNAGTNGSGGNSKAFSSTSGSDGVAASSIAIGGNAGIGSGNGGNAISYAKAMNFTDQTVSVNSTAIGGNGYQLNNNNFLFEPGGNGGVAQSTAFGSSLGGGNVNVNVTQTGGKGGSSSSTPGLGANSILDNAAIGSTSGALSLSQTAYGGTGGENTNQSFNYIPVNAQGGGNAISKLFISDSQASKLLLTSNAIGGSGGVAFYTDNGTGGNGGSAVASANGISTIGADVSVTVVQTGGSGSFGFSGGGSAASSNLENAATGSTKGILSLSQTAIGGTGGDSFQFTSSSGGNANSKLSILDSTATKLSITSRAIGGNGGSIAGVFHGQGGSGGGAIASAFGSSNIGADVSITVSQIGGSGSSGPDGGNGANSTIVNAAGGSTSGHLTLTQNAVGGNGGNFNPNIFGGGGFAGDATSTFDVVDSKANVLTLNNTAIGGSGGGTGFDAQTDPSFGRNGGNATSQSTGISTLNSQVTIFDSAQAANGGNGGSWTDDTSLLKVSNGGNASSSATGKNAGSQSVIISSTAIAGNSGKFPDDIKVGGIGGNASAYASAISPLGNSSSTSSAHAGSGLNSQGTAKSQAIANGGTGSESTATATRTGISLTAKTSIDNQSSGTSDSFVGIDQALPTVANQSHEAAVAYGTVLSGTTVGLSALENQTLTNQNSFSNVISSPFLSAELSVLNTATTLGLHIFKSELNLSFDTKSITNPQDLLISFLNPSITNSNLAPGDKLIFSYGIDGVLNQSFSVDSSNLSSVYNFFSGRTLNLGSILDLADSNSLLKLAFNLELDTQTTGAGLALGLIVGNSAAVPLPAGIWLFSTGLVGFFPLIRKYA